MKAIPKYRDVLNVIRQEIFDGKFASAGKFPSEEQLMRRFGVSRNTVRSALAELKRTGVLETRNGSGTYLSAAASRPVGTLGMIVPGMAMTEIFQQICGTFIRAARDAGYTTLCGGASSADPAIRTVQALRAAHDCAERRVAGVVFEPIELTENTAVTTTEVLSILRKARIPIVLIDRDVVVPPLRSAFDLVGIDNVRGGYRLAAYLIENGARRIHVLCRPNSAPTCRKRAQGANLALLDHGIPAARGNYHEIDPRDGAAVRAMLRRFRPDAIMCCNDATAADLLVTLRALNVRVPEDIAVTGVDGLRYASIVTPSLTTIRQPCEEIARIALKMLLERIASPALPPREILLDSELVVGQSTRNAAADDRAR
ncbi:MAG: GntR family transcriptional regulator [Kiritimatiellae bacterium]|nr:GntR family transcriptional regulator [Kiritimatiellia bacterium]